MNKVTARQCAIVEEASSWVARLDGANAPLAPSEQKELVEWLTLSPEHLQELLLCAATLQAIQDITVDARVPLETLLQEKAPAIMPFLASTAKHDKEKTVIRSQKLWTGITSIAAMLALFMLAMTYFRAPEKSINAELEYSTVVGEQRSISLSDGSIIHLNTGSKVVVAYQTTERAIQLVSGEALFKVAHDTARPFRVYAGSAIAEAVGTTFNVYRKTGKTSVAVVEGKVKVTRTNKPVAATTSLPADDTASTLQSILLTKEQSTDVTKQGAVTDIRPKEVRAITSWRDRRLIFEQDYLDDIVNEFNRYNTLKIIIDDNDLAETQFDGVFDADDPNAFIQFLQLAGGIEVIRSNNNEIILRKRHLPVPENNRA